MNIRQSAKLCGAGIALLLYAYLAIRPTFAQPVAALTNSRPFAINPQPLATALLQYTAQSGVYVTSSASLIENRKSQGVIGRFEPRIALSKILEGTDLGFDIIDDHTVVILPARVLLNPGPGEKRALSAEDTASPDDLVVSTGCRVDTLRTFLFSCEELATRI